MAFCNQCGAEMDDNAKFCKECGAPVSANDVSKNETVELPQQPMMETVKEEVPVANVPTYGSPQAAKKQFGPKKFFIFAGSAIAGVLLISLVLTIISVASSDHRVSLSDILHSGGFSYSYDYDYGYDYDDDYYDDYDYNYDSDYYDDIYTTYYGSFFYVDIPASWENHYTYEESYDSVTFYNTDNASAGYGGVLFSICRYAQGTDYQDLPSYQYLYEDSSYVYIIIYPTDVEYNYNDSSLTSLYLEMYADGESTFLSSISFY